MPSKMFMLIVNITTIFALAVSLALGWIRGVPGIIISIVSLLLMNVAAAIGLRFRTK